MKYHLKILSPRQLIVLNRLGPFLSGHGFYLAGGTAIALMLGHRKSDDLDWFSPTSLREPRSWTNKIKSIDLSPTEIDIDAGTYYATVKGVRISIIEYRYPMIRALVGLKTIGCGMSSLDDLACMKLSAIVSRGSKKDFIDVYALMKKHKPLQAMLQLYKKKFPEADVFPVIRGLSYFDDADKERMPRMLWSITWKEVKHGILSEVEKLVK